MSKENLPTEVKKKKTTESKNKPPSADKNRSKKIEEELDIEDLDDLEDLDDGLEDLVEDDLDNDSVSDGIVEDMARSLDDDSKLLRRDALERLRLNTDKSFGKAVCENAETIYNLFREVEIYDLTTLLQYDAKTIDGKIKDSGKKLKGFGPATIQKILEKAQELAGTKAFVPSTEVHISNVYIHSGSVEIDNLLGGGFALGASYEIYGSFGGGKTQICASVVCRSFLPRELGGLMEEGKDPHYVLWFDSEETLREMMRDKEFKEKIKAKAKEVNLTAADYARGYIRRREISRMERICRSLNLDFEKDVKPYILHVPLDTVNQQLRRIEEAHEITSQYNVKVIVLDSITKLIRQERQADEAYTQRISRTINVMLGHLNKIKTKCDASLICTNQVYSNMMAYGSKRYSEETYGGSSVKHSLDKRLHVWNHKDGIRCAELVDSASDRCMGDTENSMVNFIITDGGIADVGD